MAALWPETVERVPLGQAAFALRLPAQHPTDAPPVVLVHGFRGCAMEFGPLAQALSEERDVWVPELITGRTPGLEPVHGLLDAVADTAGEGPVDVVGSSMGGYVATTWAARRQGALTHLALLAPALVPLQPAWRLPGVTRLIALQRALDADERRWERQVATASPEEFFERETPRHLDVPEVWRRAVLEHQRASIPEPAAVGRRLARQAVLRDLMRTLRRRGAVAQLLSAVRVPVLWLHGDRDPLVPFEPSREVARQLPSCTFEPVEGAGHILHLECPEVAAQRVLEQSALA
jgi:pimeloyl-ACP methyl ester carboxylesterase